MSSSNSSRKRRSCAVCGSTEGIQICARCYSVGYCGEEHQKQHWKAEHKRFCKYIPGTKVRRDAPMRDNPLDPSLCYPRGRTGKTSRDPLHSFRHYKVTVRAEPKTRLIKPGKLTTFITDAAGRELPPGQRPTPYTEEGSKQVKLPNGKYRHIASFSLEELRKLGWDGALYNSRETYAGRWVPFVCGYDSESDYEYEPFEVSEGERNGTIGLPHEEVGLYMEIPTHSENGVRTEVFKLNRK